MDTMSDRIEKTLRDAVRVKEQVLANGELVAAIQHIAEALISTYRAGGKLLVAGNGGSAADAQHFAAEITSQYQLKRKARPAIALHCDTSALTAWANDHSFDTAFARQVEAHGRPGDVLVVITTSGNSKDLIQAALRARSMGLKVFGLLGRDGGQLAKDGLCDLSFVAPSMETPRIQECHILVIHLLCEELDRFFYEADNEGV